MTKPADRRGSAAGRQRHQALVDVPPSIGPVVFGTRGVGWVMVRCPSEYLWLARPRHEANGDKAKADLTFSFSARGTGVIVPDTHVRFHEAQQHDLFHSTP